jgi:hypothetical protein
MSFGSALRSFSNKGIGWKDLRDSPQNIFLRPPMQYTVPFLRLKEQKDDPAAELAWGHNGAIEKSGINAHVSGENTVCRGGLYVRPS